jgi:hypothetical protein
MRNIYVTQMAELTKFIAKPRQENKAQNFAL